MSDILNKLEEVLTQAQKEFKKVKAEKSNDENYVRSLREEKNELIKAVLDLKNSKAGIEAQISKDKSDILKRIEQKESDADAAMANVRAEKIGLESDRKAFEVEKREVINLKAKYEIEIAATDKLKAELENKLTKHKEAMAGLR